MLSRSVVSDYFQVSAIESLLVAEGVTQIMGWVGDEVNATTTQADIDTKVGQIHGIVG